MVLPPVHTAGQHELGIRVDLVAKRRGNLRNQLVRLKPIRLRDA